MSIVMVSAGGGLEMGRSQEVIFEGSSQGSLFSPFHVHLSFRASPAADFKSSTRWKQQLYMNPLTTSHRCVRSNPHSKSYILYHTLWFCFLDGTLANTDPLTRTEDVGEARISLPATV